MSGDLKDLAIRIYAARKHMGLTLEELSNLTGVSVSYLSKLENSKRSNPNIDVIKKILRALEIEENLYEYKTYTDKKSRLYPEMENIDFESLDAKIEFLSERLRINNRKKKLDGDELIYLIEVLRDIVFTQDEKEEPQNYKD